MAEDGTNAGFLCPIPGCGGQEFNLVGYAAALKDHTPLYCCKRCTAVFTDVRAFGQFILQESENGACDPYALIAATSGAA